MNQAALEKTVWFRNDSARDAFSIKSDTELFSPDRIRAVRRFHKSVPRFQPTPLVSLPQLAGYLGVSSIHVKDESYRCGLNAFKVLGASHGIARALAQRLGMEGDTLDLSPFTDPHMRQAMRSVTLVTATDGNHGRAVAWMAEQLECRSVVFMPRGSSPLRVESIRQHGAKASVIDGNYDDAVERAAGLAEKNGWLLIQDTARPGYEEIPAWIMQGYAVMIDEACEQMGNQVPSHVFAQCGVGSFAAAIQAYLIQKYGHERPVFVVVEPTRAACYFKSITSEARLPVRVHGDMDTIMAGLACGEPSRSAWEILKDYADMFVACPDAVAMRGMRALGNPLPGDAKIISGESGAVTLGLTMEIAENDALKPLREELGMNAASRLLFFSTEGDTDPEAYRRIVGAPGRGT